MSIYPFKWPTGFSYKNGWSLFCFYIYEIYTYPSFQNTPTPIWWALDKGETASSPRCRHGKSLPNTIFLEELSWQIITTTTARKQATVQKAFSVPLIIMAPMGARRVTVAKVFSALQTTSDGRKKGYSSNGSFGTRNYYDSSGRKTGYSSKGLFGTINYYDASGKKKGYKSKSWW